MIGMGELGAFWRSMTWRVGLGVGGELVPARASGQSKKAVVLVTHWRWVYATGAAHVSVRRRGVALAPGRFDLGEDPRATTVTRLAYLHS